MEHNGGYHSFSSNLVRHGLCVARVQYRCSICNVVINTTEWWRQIFGDYPTKMSAIKKLDMHILSLCVLYSTFHLSKQYINVKIGLEIGSISKWQAEISIFI